MVRKAFLLAALCCLWGCSNTAVKTEWRDPAYAGTAARSLAVLCLPADSEEKECEDEFVRQLAEANVSAIPGYRMSMESVSSDKVMQKARERGLNRVLVSRFLHVRAKYEPVWPESTNMFGVPDYGTYYDYHLEERDFQVFQTVLYDAKNGKPIWAAQSDTFVVPSQKKTLKSYVKAMIKKLKHQGLLSH